MNQPLVSIITGFYNVERFLQEAIDGVLQQEYTNWQFFIVDDGSTDGSTTIAKENAARHPGRIFYLEHENHVNKGVCASRNLAMEHAKGQLIAILDADDVWEPKKLLQQVELFATLPNAAMICQASEYWYTWDAPQSTNVVIPVGAPQDKLYMPGELNKILYPLAKGAAPCPSAIIMQKQAVLDIGGFENSFTGRYQMYEDQAFLSKMYLHHKVYVSSACNNLYRQRYGSLVQWVTSDGHYLEVRKFFLEWFRQYLQDQQINDPEIHRLLRKALWPYEHPLLNSIVKKLRWKKRS
jgi:glycosyltransferase involved in cell wall biosynthesis